MKSLTPEEQQQVDDWKFYAASGHLSDSEMAEYLHPSTNIERQLELRKVAEKRLFETFKFFP